MRYHLLYTLCITLGLVTVSCQESKKGPTDTPTQGKIHIAVDEAFLPVIAAEITAFKGFYPKANVIPHYVDEKTGFDLLMKDSVRLVISSRPFTEEEIAFYKEKTLSVKSVKIATDAIAVVLNHANPDTLLTLSKVKSILNGADWKTISGKGISGIPTLVFDKPTSSNVLALERKLEMKLSQIDASRIVYSGGDRETINYVHDHPNCIGFIGVNWISDLEDPTQTRFKSGVHVAHLMPDSMEKLLAKNPLTTNEEYFQPLQAYLAQGFYPLTRDMVVASREARSGLGTGFTAWLASDKGQRIVLKAGLLPATMPIRVVKIKKDNDLTN
jgi:phosphate transport system substrate-binding protein